VTEDVDALAFNTAISQLMIFVNEFLNAETKPRPAMEAFVLLLSPFAPHIAEELWELLGHRGTLAYHPWPAFDEAKTQVAEIEIAVQVNGKVRGKFGAPPDSPEEFLRERALAETGVKQHIAGKEIVRVVAVKNRLVSIVVR
jgi:leucyl-tRNA synthetase